MSNFLISGLVCAQIVLAEKLVKPPTTPAESLEHRYGTKAFGALSRILRQGRNPSARPSLRVAKRWINRHIITIPFVCFLLLTFYDLPPCGTHINPISVLFISSSCSTCLQHLVLLHMVFIQLSLP
jgi:hypothetical protein